MRDRQKKFADALTELQTKLWEARGDYSIQPERTEDETTMKSIETDLKATQGRKNREAESICSGCGLRELNPPRTWCEYCGFRYKVK